jgi:acyl-coenzyme A thioesterase PaaI-like protein
MSLLHHDLCFGCGQTNLFGLLLEVERVDAHRVAGRCFIKQDHQGPDRRFAHQGVLAAALCEAMALASGPQARALELNVELRADAPVGAFVDVEAATDEPEADTIAASATAASEGRTVATARGRFEREHASSV